MSALDLVVSRSGAHSLPKTNGECIRLVAGLGVEGDPHAGATVKHRSRVSRDRTEANLRQVHLLHAELFEELAAAGVAVRPGKAARKSPSRASTF